MKRIYSKITILVLILIGGINNLSAQSPDIYAVGPYVDTLWTVDTTGVYTNLSATHLTLPSGNDITGCNGLAKNPSTGIYYIMLKISGVTGRVLATVDPTTAICDSIGNTGDNIAQIAFINGTTMVAVTGDGATASESLHYVDINTGALSLITATGGAGSDGESLGFCPDNGMVYRWSGRDTDPAMEKWDLSDTTMTTITRTGYNYDEPQGIMYIGNGEFLLANLDQEFVVIDTSGFATLLPSSVAIAANTSYIKGMAPVGRSISASSTTICANDSTLLSASEGQSYQWHMNGTVIASATSQDYLAYQTGVYNCVIEDNTLNPIFDSVPTGISLLVLPAITGTIDSTICMGDNIVINGNTYDTTTVSAIEVFANVGPYMCDSTVTINLTVLDLTGTIDQNICSGDNIVVNGNTYDTTTVGAIEVITNVGPYMCDSTVTINLTVLPVKTGTLDSTICFGDNIIVNGNTYDTTTVGAIEVIANVGPSMCDSTVTINLTIAPELTGSITQTICNGDSIVVNGTTYNTTVSGATEIFTNIGPNMCDSTVTIDLTVLPALTGTVDSTICMGDNIIINGNTYDSTSIGATEIFTNIGPNLCDSTVTINLTVLELTGTITQTICNGDSIVVNGTTYNTTVSGATEVFTNVGPYQCDSTVTINLTVENAIDVTVTNSSPVLTANATGATYQWLDCDNANAIIPSETNQSFNATVNGNYAVEVTIGSCVDTSACESVIGIGIIEFTNNSLSIYPNPVTNTLTINIDKLAADLTIDIVNIEGKVVYTNNNITNTKLVVDSRSWSKGVYAVKIYNNENTQTIKLIKE